MMDGTVERVVDDGELMITFVVTAILGIYISQIHQDKS